MKNLFIQNLINDLNIILDGEDNYIIRYDEDTEEIITNISGDKICYYDMTNKQDREDFIKYLFRFLNKVRKSQEFKQKKLELR